jgi:hypothetical protein
MKRAAPAACALFVLAGCGGGPGKAPDAASLVPPDALSFLRARTSQLPRAAALLARFPAHVGVLGALPPAPPGAGPELDVATLAGGRVFFTQPTDQKALVRRLDATGRVHARIRGWTVYATRQSLLDAVHHRRGNLADRAWYVAASNTLPAGAALREVRPGWRAAAVTVHRRDVEVAVHRLRTSLPESSSTLADVVPDDAIAAAGAAGPLTVPAGAPALLYELAVAAGGPLVGWVRPGADLPEVTVVAKPAAPLRALKATARLVARLTKNPAVDLVTVDGIRLRQVSNGAIDLYYGLVAGRLVLSDDATAAASAGPAGKRLTVVSQLPGATESWAYLNVAEGLPLARAYSGLFNETVPPAFAASLSTLRGFLVYSAHEGRVATTVTRLDLRPRP